MVFRRGSNARRPARGDWMAAWSSSSTSFVVPIVLLVAAVLMGWIFFGSLSPTVDNTGTTTPVAQPALPSPTTKPETP